MYKYKASQRIRIYSSLLSKRTACWGSAKIQRKKFVENTCVDLLETILNGKCTCTLHTIDHTEDGRNCICENWAKPQIKRHSNAMVRGLNRTKKSFSVSSASEMHVNYIISSFQHDPTDSINNNNTDNPKSTIQYMKCTRGCRAHLNLK